MKSQFGKILVACCLLGALVEAGSETLPARMQMQFVALSQEEKAGLLMMREEEKLAHDVYQALYRRWQLPVFANISRSETQHMAAMAMLLHYYGLDDPVQEQEGRFTDKKLQNLYNELVDVGKRSYADALKVGAQIEELDIADLNRLAAGTQQTAILGVYAQLTRGSRNHLRSFHRQLQVIGENYQPQHLPVAEYEAIVTSEMERGRH